MVRNVMSIPRVTKCRRCSNNVRIFVCSVRDLLKIFWVMNSNNDYFNIICLSG